MAVPEITDHDEWNYLKKLTRATTVGNPKVPEWGYYACVLRHKYPGCDVRITDIGFQILQPGFSADLVPFTEEQVARHHLFNTFAPRLHDPSKDSWLIALEMNGLLPDRSS